MSAEVFVDTNILVYSRDSYEPGKQHIAREALKRLWERKNGRISTQVLNEYFVTVTRKLTHKLSEPDAWEDVEDLESWNPVPVDMYCLKTGRHVQLRYGLSWRDSLIVAAASIAGCETILSEDLNPGQQYLGITVVSPFMDN
jgi:predicted nucleic acid-binding protein